MIDPYNTSISRQASASNHESQDPLNLINKIQGYGNTLSTSLMSQQQSLKRNSLSSSVNWTTPQREPLSVKVIETPCGLAIKKYGEVRKF